MADKLPVIHRATREATADAGVILQFVRRDRQSVQCGVGRRGNDNQPRCRRQRQRHHVTGQTVTETDAGIETASDDIHQSVIRDHFQPHLRAGLVKACEQRRQQQSCRCPRHIQPQRAAGRITEQIDLVERLANLAQRRRQPRQQALAGLGRGDAARGAVQQTHAHARLQSAQCMAKAAMARHAGERLQLSQIGRGLVAMGANLVVGSGH